MTLETSRRLKPHLGVGVVVRFNGPCGVTAHAQDSIEKRAGHLMIQSNALQSMLDLQNEFSEPSTLRGIEFRPRDPEGENIRPRLRTQSGRLGGTTDQTQVG